MGPIDSRMQSSTSLQHRRGFRIVQFTPPGSACSLQFGTKLTSAAENDLVSALQRAAAAHGEHERRIGQKDPNWSAWYVEYMVSEQTGKELPR